MKMIEAAKSSGADAVKFQTFKAEEFCGDINQKFTYRSQGKLIEENMLDMFKRYEFSKDEWKLLQVHCLKNEITFLSTPQNIGDLSILLELDVPAVKVGSDDLNNIPLLREYSKTKKPIILSCGMSSLSEVHEALEAIGWFEGYPVCLMVCTSQYPSPLVEVNIKRVTTLKDSFPGLTIGFSDHTQGSAAAIMGVALGAAVFEKHFTMDKNYSGPDHWFSEDLNGLKNWVENINNAFLMLGDGFVRPSATEIENKKEFQRVLVAAREIRMGEIFTKDNLTMRRVSGGLGLPPIMLDYFIGRQANKHYAKYSAIGY
jgi:N-acetylneuraminate synthase/N,N'-diacetyllegionaminate synthase